MQLSNILLSLAAVAGLVNAAPTPAPANAAQVFSYSSCLTVSYDTPQGVAFYDIEAEDKHDFESHCGICLATTNGCADDVCKESKFAECAKTIV